MSTLNTNQTSINASIGSNNQNINIYTSNEALFCKITVLIKENEKLRGLLDNAISQLKIKDELLKILTR